MKHFPKVRFNLNLSNGGREVWGLARYRVRDIKLQEEETARIIKLIGGLVM